MVKILAALLCVLMLTFSGCGGRSAPELRFKEPETMSEEPTRHIKGAQRRQYAASYRRIGFGS